ncbi:hypothetical protein [Actinomadura harenae]|uniref:Uncharacterized protein n=1 Tax=Actinomadura harenae TaxID=2483351 RepID=A0A3M2LM62_9ACTN|nr:hypothetical protein [Actinomadura harenae]RMI37175.1 hypothetical protein EBO15_36540 [Actinomadura harenae]
MQVEIETRADGVSVVRSEARRVVACFYDDPVREGWFVAHLPDGTTRRLWAPDGDRDEVARRLVRDR